MFSIFIRYNTLGGVCVFVFYISKFQFLRRSVCSVFTRYSTLGGVCALYLLVTVP